MRAITCLAFLCIIANLALAGVACSPSGNAPAGEGTRAGEIGWQYDTFAQNLMVNVTPTEITTLDSMTITVNSVVQDVWIKQANLYGVVYPNDAMQFPFSYPFLKISDTEFECTLEPFPLNGYTIEFYIVAYDYFFVPMDSRTAMTLSYDVQGTGWQYDTFDGNIELAYSPTKVNATEEVTVNIQSKQDTYISGANLYIMYETKDGTLHSGGYNFTRLDVNSTKMYQKIPGYSAGTDVRFWVTAWDMYNSIITSKTFNYTVLGDTAPPLISSLTCAYTEKDTMAVVRANVSDDIAVDSVVLFFRASDSERWVQRTMSDIGDGKYEFTIPAQDQTGDVTIYYYVNATDTSGNLASSLSSQGVSEVELAGVGDVDEDEPGVENGTYWLIAIVIAVVIVMGVLLMFLRKD